MLLHGIGGNRGQWAHQAISLASQFTVLTCDTRGYGDSDGPRAIQFSDFADDVIALLDALGLRSVLAVGHSMGGRTLIEAAIRAPERFSALLLSGAQSAYLEHMSAEERTAYIAKRMALFEGPSVTADAATRVAREVLGPTVATEAFDRMTEDFMALRREGYLAALNASAGWDRRAQLDELRMPVEIIGGALDPICPVSQTQELANAIGQGDPIILDGVGHMAQIEASERVTNLISSFAARHAHLTSGSDAEALHLAAGAESGL
ncbi:MAG: alpha/beta hydrolase [Pseudomonadota bacterium]